MFATVDFSSTLYRLVMWVGGFWCHQMPGRSPHLGGVQMPLCWRCSGIAVGAVVLFAWIIGRRKLPPLVLSIIFALAMPLDVLHTVMTDGAGDNARRLLTGLLWGFFGVNVVLHLTKFIDERRGRARAARAAHRSPSVFRPL